MRYNHSLKRLLLTTALVFITMLHTSFSPPTATITFVITGLRSDKGSVFISLFDSKKHFPGRVEGSVGNGRSAIQNGRATVSFRDLPYGRYAAAMMHDENDNQEMDYNILGMPKEGYGFSNGAKAAFAPPTFDKAAIKLDEAMKRTTIVVIYL